MQLPSNIKYITESTLRVGWDSELSPFHKDFDKTFKEVENQA